MKNSSIPKFILNRDRRQADHAGRVRAVARALATDLRQVIDVVPPDVIGGIRHVYARDLKRFHEVVG